METQGKQIAELQQGMADLSRDGGDKTRLIEGLREEVEGLKEQLGRDDDRAEDDGQTTAAVDARLERLEGFAKLNGK